MESHVLRSRRIGLLALASCAPHVAVLPVPTRDVGTLHISGAPSLDRAIERALDPYAAIAQARLLDIAGDGGDLLALQAGDVLQLRRDASPTPRIADLDAEWAAFVGDDVIALADRDGDEDARLYRRTDAGIALLIAGHGRMTDPIARHGRIVWAETDGARTTLWLREPDGAIRSVFADDGAWSPLDLSRDGQQLLARHTISVRSSAISRIDLPSGHATSLTSLAAATPLARFGDDVVLAVSDARADHLGLWEIGASGQRLLAGSAWDVTQLAVAPDGNVIAFVTNEDGGSVLRLYDRNTGTQQIAAGAPAGGVITELRCADAAPVLAFSFTDATHPRTVLTYDLLEHAVVERASIGLGALANTTLVPALHARVTSFDRASLPILAYRPSHPRAVVIDLHGGPEDQWLPKWLPFEQFLASRGIAVVMPNVRGSTGFGKAFASLDDDVHREDAVRDIGAVVSWIARQRDLAGRPISVMGTSYGGYLALAALVAYPGQLRAGIDMVGITDFPSFLAGTRSDRRDQRRAEYGDERVARSFLARISPIAHAAAIKAPLLVAQGRRDPRVPPSDADRFVAAVRRGGGTVWYVTADDEGHGFEGAENRGTFEVLATQLVEATVSRTSPN